jgi:patatin-like phospholipase/acyl hydrolase
MEDGSRTFKVLSIDGGGIKGLYSAEILQQFEKEFDCHIADHFDLLCGTSTGGLIALALADRVPAAKIVGFYEQWGRVIFPRRARIWGRAFVKLLFGMSQYSPKPLRKAATALFGDKLMCDLRTLVCVPSYSLTAARPYIFKRDHADGKLTRDGNTRIVDVAMATAAAPTYFPIVEAKGHEGHQFIDGGVYANNPTLIGLMDAFRFFVGVGKRYDAISVLSISSLDVPTGSRLRRWRGAIRQFKREVIPAFMTGQAKMTDFMMCQFDALPEFPVKYVRVPSVVVGPDQVKHVQLDSATKKAMKLIRSMGRDQGFEWKNKEEITAFFSTPCSYRIED